MDTPMGASSVAVPLTHQLSASGLHGSLSYRKGLAPVTGHSRGCPVPAHAWHPQEKPTLREVGSQGLRGRRACPAPSQAGRDGTVLPGTDTPKPGHHLWGRGCFWKGYGPPQCNAGQGTPGKKGLQQWSICGLFWGPLPDCRLGGQPARATPGSITSKLSGLGLPKTSPEPVSSPAHTGEK